MSLTLALNNAISGLRINQQSISVLSQNIANVNTEGYSRQILSQSAITIEGVGSGVKLDEITRKIDKYLLRSSQTQGSVNASAQTISDYYQRIQGLIGQPGAANSIDTFMTTFFNSIQRLAETPETSSLKSNAVAAGATLASQMSDLAANVYELQYEADREIGEGVTTVNNTLKRLYNLNSAINQAATLKQSTAGLLDERDKALATLASFMNISTTYTETGAVSIVTGDGISILEEGNEHILTYSRAQSADTFIQNGITDQLEVLTINNDGAIIGSSFVLFTAAKADEVKTTLTGGSIHGLQQMRDIKLPAILAQLDELASKLRDNVNAIHNDGSGFPPAKSLSGERLVTARDQYNWSGQVRIAVLQPDGKPVPSRYSDETYTGIRPLNLDLSRLDSGQGNGKPTMQTIIDEINNHFGSPGNKVKLGNLNNIQLASDTLNLPSGSTSLFNFDLDAENISETNARMFVTGTTVLDEFGADITNVTQTQPSVSLALADSYVTTNLSADVTITLSTTPGVAVGDTIYLNPPTGATVNGIPAASLTGFFTVTAVNGNQITFTAGAPATSTGSVNDAGAIEMLPPYDTIGAGEQRRTRDSGQLQVNLSGNLSSRYYDITVDVAVVGEDDVVRTSQITYRVPNNETNIYNKRYDSLVANGDATLVIPNSSQESLRAILVDANGNELPKLNGKYLDTPGYLKIIGGNASETFAVALDELDSKQLGKPEGSPVEAGTNRGFSHYFGLNNYFTSNNPTSTGDTLRNSAINLSVEERLIRDANLITTGTITRQPKSVANNGVELYSYIRYSGDNSISQRMAQLNTQVLTFEASGGLPRTDLSLQSYSGEVIGYISQRTAEASDNAANAKTLYDGFKDKSDAISGVNLDEELANTVIFQNAYAATARIITAVNKMYEDLLQSF